MSNIKVEKIPPLFVSKLNNNDVVISKVSNSYVTQHIQR